jgi:hypothetical protein
MSLRPQVYAEQTAARAVTFTEDYCSRISGQTLAYHLFTHMEGITSSDRAAFLNYKNVQSSG